MSLSATVSPYVTVITKNLPSGRIKASTFSGSQVIVSWDYSQSYDDNHKSAFLAFCQKMKWEFQSAKWIGGTHKDLTIWTRIE